MRGRPLPAARVTARPFAESDLAFLQEMGGQPSIRRADAVPPREDAEGWRRFVEARTSGGGRMYLLEADGAPAGFLVLIATHVPEIYEIGYAVHEAQQRRGIATRAVAAALPAAFGALKCERVQAVIQADNAASARVLEKAGFAREGVLRRGMKINDALIDASVYALLRDDFLRR